MITENIYCPPNKIKLNNKATHVIYYNVCLLHNQKLLLPGSFLPAEVPSLRLAGYQGGSSGRPHISVHVCEKDTDAGGWCTYVDCTGHQLHYNNMDRHIKQTPVHHVAPALCPQPLHSSYTLQNTALICIRQLNPKWAAMLSRLRSIAQ